MTKNKRLELLGYYFELMPLTLKYATEVMDYQSANTPIPYDFKVDCLLNGVKVKEGEHYLKLTHEKLNLIFMGHPGAFTLMFAALIKLSFEDDLKKSAEYLEIAQQLSAA